MPCNPESPLRARLAAPLSELTARARTLHDDERGTISVLSVIVMLLLTMLLGMILNVGEQIDDKIKLQNAADAASYSSGVVMARGLNTLAFTNHLLSETFALTAYHREGRDRFAESLVPEILDRWEAVGRQLGLSEFETIRNIQPALSPKIQMERELVRNFGEMTAIKARLLLPAFEMILGIPETANGMNGVNPRQVADSHLIPQFQRAVVQAIAESSIAVSNEIAKRNTPGPNVKSTQCVIWSLQSNTNLAIDEHNPIERLLPALDPSTEGPDFRYLSSGEVFVYQEMARKRRDDLARHYLREWIDDDNYDLGPFERETLATGGRVSAKMSQFINLFRGFTCAKLAHLLNEEFPQSNLPHMLRQPLSRTDRAVFVQVPDLDGAGNVTGFHTEFHGAYLSQQKFLDLDYTFIGAVYRKQRPPTMPGMYRTPIKGDALAFSGFTVYLPRSRYVTTGGCPRFYGLMIDGWSGTTSCGTPAKDRWPEEWSLFSQNWAARMIPAASEGGLAAAVMNPNQLAPGVKLPNLKAMQLQDLKAVSFH